MEEDIFQNQWKDLPPAFERVMDPDVIKKIVSMTPVKVEGANLYNSSFENNGTAQMRKVSDACPDAITMHTISLLQHNRAVRELLATHALNLHIDPSCELPEAPPIPEAPECALEPKRTDDKVTESTKGDFAKNKQRTFAVLPHSVAWKILRKSVAVIFAHAGYNTTSDGILDTLTDIVQDYYIRVCSVLRKNADKNEFSGEWGFIDVLEQTFHDIGLGSITMLHYFYQSRIVDYHNRVLKSCELLMGEYDRLKIQSTRTKAETADNEMKMECDTEMELQIEVEDEIRVTKEICDEQSQNSTISE